MDIHRDIHIISGHPFGYPILILDIQFELWISNPYPFQNYRYPLGISTLIMDILLDIQFLIAAPPCCFALLPISHLI